ncbi:iron ABC transporter permease [Lysinibacillus sphaericus]|uniref:FecCD family ABC transporter permease n=1 Tax=Lysinibacillus sphaericus TaxID=1421 RepID=UPI0018CCDC5A|nr:iron ABC transporter permease [Lysinibacillus sphaericus]MBG9452599.1 iron ABC transporter permease [Lysinibacillus sphaericus]MBG9476979.1 iron ABC transporter permease [Lysinibacillus sphaericus]MBG9592748.1 iron ABC transporter permease [Lysinibacillus sphaericus]
MKQLKTVRLLQNKISFLLDVKASKKLTFISIMTLAVFFFSASFGDSFINPFTVIQTLFGKGSEFDQLIIVDFRMPRIFLAAFAGMALAVAGAILQGIIKNPLASPDIISISAGGGAAVVGFLAMFSDSNHSLTVSIEWLPLAGFIGATIVGLIVYVFAWKDGVTPTRLVLIGIGVSAFMQAITTMLMIIGPIYQASEANKWITGSVKSADWNQVQIVVPLILVLLLITFFITRQLNVQELGDDTAASLGQSVQKARLLLIILSSSLVASAIAFAGAIGFVGLMAPHIARRIVGPSFGVLIPTSAAIGALLVMVADIIGRTAFSPLEVPAGVFTAAIGAPYFIYLLFRNPRK